MRSSKHERAALFARHWLLVVALGVTVTGCASMADSVATRMAEKDMKSLDHEFGVFEAELALFRRCVKERGGTCQGSDTTALPHSSQDIAAQAISSSPPGSSQTLTDSVAKLPSGHPAQTAMTILAHPVVRQAAALHNQIRGHEPDKTPGVTVEKKQGAHGGPESTVTLGLGVGQIEHLHKGMLSSLGTTAWQSLDDHCTTLLAANQASPDRQRLETDCRRVAFIRGYLEAYVRKGEFVEVDVKLAAAIEAVKIDAAKVKAEIAALSAKLKSVETEVDQEEDKAVGELGTEAGKVGGAVAALISKIEGEITRRFGKAASAIFSDLASSTSEVQVKAAALAQSADTDLDKEIQALASEVEGLLQKIGTDLGKLGDQVSTLDQKVVQDINDELDKADAELSNVFKVSSVGFVSRDDTFRARLPTLEVTLDPTARQLVKVTDVETGQVLSRDSSFGELGVATDSSGVGTGGRIGAEVVRVFLEALFDAHEGLPAVAPANQANARPTGLNLDSYSLPLFKSPLGSIDSRDLSRMTDTNDQIAAKTRAILSRIIAGIGPFSLNNQPLEDFIVEIITTSVHKATSKVTWCWYACDLDGDLKTLEADARTAAEGEAKRAAGDARSEARQEAERLRLRLKLSR